MLTKKAYKGGPYKPLMNYMEGIICYTYTLIRVAKFLL